MTGDLGTDFKVFSLPDCAKSLNSLQGPVGKFNICVFTFLQENLIGALLAIFGHLVISIALNLQVGIMKQILILPQASCVKKHQARRSFCTFIVFSRNTATSGWQAPKTPELTSKPRHGGVDYFCWCWESWECFPLTLLLLFR